jgi:hypothetical protein
MKHPCLALALSLSAGFAAAQDLIYYKFDSACTTEIINYATGAQALGNGTLQSNSAISPYDVGYYDNCLAGGAVVAPTYYNRVVTGWNPSTQPLTGDLTIAWFMRLRTGASVGTTLTYLAGAPSGGIRLFTNGIAGLGLLQREILQSGGTPTARDFQLPAATFDVQAAAAAGWVHMAIVVNAAAQTADWFVNGASLVQLTNVPGALMTLAGPYTIGSYSTAATGAGSPYDIDEYILSNRAYSTAEVLALANGTRGADGDYTSNVPSQCGAGNASLASAGGAPSLGNLGYGLQITTTQPSVYLLLVGLDRCLLNGSVPLPLDGTPLLPLLNGCWIVADAPVLLSGVTIAGPAVQPFPIPSTLALGTNLYTQALALDVVTSASSMSNGFASAIGF